MEVEIEKWFLSNCRHYVEDFAKRLDKQYFQFTMEVYGAEVLEQHLINNVDSEALKYLNLARFLVEWEKRHNRIMNIVVCVKDGELKTLETYDDAEKMELLQGLPKNHIWIVSLCDGDEKALKVFEEPSK